MNECEILIKHINQLHSTELGIKRVKKNLHIYEEFDIIEWCKKLISDPHCFIKKQGKNWYATVEDYTFTINASSYTLITAHKF